MNTLNTADLVRKIFSQHDTLNTQDTAQCDAERQTWFAFGEKFGSLARDNRQASDL